MNVLISAEHKLLFGMEKILEVELRLLVKDAELFQKSIEREGC